MWRDFLLFLPLAVLTNSTVPLPFDPVLIYFTSHHPFKYAWVFALVGSLCAGVAGIIDVKLLGKLSRVLAAQPLPLLRRCTGRWFYLATFLFAFLPLPFSLIRLIIFGQQPRPVLYGLMVMLGRLPRYLLIIYFWQAMALPPQVNGILILIALAVLLYQWRGHIPIIGDRLVPPTLDDAQIQLAE